MAAGFSPAGGQAARREVNAKPSVRGMTRERLLLALLWEHGPLFLARCSRVGRTRRSRPREAEAGKGPHLLAKCFSPAS